MEKYVIRPSQRKLALDIMTSGDNCAKNYSRTKSFIINNKPMGYARWLRYFDFNIIDDIIMPEGATEEIVEVDENSNDNNDLGI